MMISCHDPEMNRNGKLKKKPAKNHPVPGEMSSSIPPKRSKHEILCLFCPCPCPCPCDFDGWYRSIFPNYAALQVVDGQVVKE